MLPCFDSCHISAFKKLIEVGEFLCSHFNIEDEREKATFSVLLLVIVPSYIQLFVTPWSVACQAPLSMEFSGQEYWSGPPLPTPGDLPNPRIEAMFLVSSALAGGFFITEPPGTPTY